MGAMAAAAGYGGRLLRGAVAAHSEPTAGNAFRSFASAADIWVSLERGLGLFRE